MAQDTCKGKHCPLLNKKCIEHRCAFYQMLFGKNPQDGSPLNEFDCALRWQNVLLIENSDIQRHTVAEIEALRAETSERTMSGVGSVLQAIAQQNKQIGGGS